MAGEPRLFYWASFALAIGGGFRPELLLVLLPLWCWTAWQLGNRGLAVRSGCLFLAATSVWVAGLAMSMGGPAQMVSSFAQYASEQTYQTSILFGAQMPEWRRMLGRTIIWTGLGTLPWIWALPFGWIRSRELPDQPRCLWFLLVWFVPPFLFHALVHSPAPVHVA